MIQSFARARSRRRTYPPSTIDDYRLSTTVRARDARCVLASVVDCRLAPIDRSIDRSSGLDRSIGRWTCLTNHDSRFRDTSTGDERWVVLQCVVERMRCIIVPAAVRRDGCAYESCFVCCSFVVVVVARSRRETRRRRTTGVVRVERAHRSSRTRRRRVTRLSRDEFRRRAQRAVRGAMELLLCERARRWRRRWRARDVRRRHQRRIR